MNTEQKITVVKRVTFDSAHFLYNDKFGQDLNCQIFGKCSPFKTGGPEFEPHGHTYVLEVHVTGLINRNTGFVIDFKVLKMIINDEIVDVLDHRLLNNVIPESYAPYTVENMLLYLSNDTKLKERISEVTDNQAHVSKLRMWETEGSYSEINIKEQNDCNCDFCAYS